MFFLYRCLAVASQYLHLRQKALELRICSLDGGWFLRGDQAGWAVRQENQAFLYVVMEIGKEFKLQYGKCLG